MICIIYIYVYIYRDHLGILWDNMSIIKQHACNSKELASQWNLSCWHCPQCPLPVPLCPGVEAWCRPRNPVSQYGGEGGTSKIIEGLEGNYGHFLAVDMDYFEKSTALFLDPAKP